MICRWALLFSMLLTVQGFFLKMGGGPIRADQIPSLIRQIEQKNYGAISDNSAQVKAIIDDIAIKNADFVSREKNFDEKVSGTWELLWTSEQETLFFVSKGLFGKPVSRITQTIDTNTNFLNNLIEFEGGREFSVIGQIARDNDNKIRLNFQFRKAIITIPPFPSLTLPPIGKGWFDTVYVNEKYRLSKDVRGDYLVSQRV